MLYLATAMSMAWRKSALMSSMCSMPTETRIRLGLTPHDSCNATREQGRERQGRQAGRQARLCSRPYLLLSAELLVGGGGRVDDQGLGVTHVGCKHG